MFRRFNGLVREKTCCFSGHRDIPKQYEDEVKGRLRREIRALAESGVVNFVAGGAVGFDTMAALTVLELKREYQGLKLHLFLPCPGQTSGWNERNKEIFEHIKGYADSFTYAEEKYQIGCMQKRNRQLVEASRYCICYLTDSKGGTAYTINYAKKSGLKIINLAAETEISLWDFLV